MGPLHQGGSIGGAEEGPGHHLMQREEGATTYATIFSYTPLPLYQETAIVIEDGE